MTIISTPPPSFLFLPPSATHHSPNMLNTIKSYLPGTSDDTESSTTSRPGRPTLGSNARSRSYLQEHVQYRPPQQEAHAGIDSIVESLSSSQLESPKQILPYNGVPSHDNPAKIVESGLIHTFSHATCQPAPETIRERFVATLIYKTRVSRGVENDETSPSPRASVHSLNASRELPANLAPVRTLSNFPLEPPPPDTESLDHLYGSYISPLCLTSFLHLISSLPLSHGAETITSSHRCLDNPEHPTIVELTFAPIPNPEYLTLQDLRKHELIYRFEQEWNVDVIIQPDTILRKYPRLVVFDMDSTLIEQEVIDLIAASKGLEAEVSAITARAMAGELDFSASFKERVRLLKGVDEDIFVKLRDVITPTKGAKELIRALKKMGVKTAVVSGGFLPLTQWLASQLGLDYAYANTVEIVEGKLTGEVNGTIVNAERKRDLLLEIAEKEGIDAKQTVAVGDGANDLLMMGVAGLGAAFDAKPVVQMEAGARLNGGTLLDLLHVFGFSREEVDILIS